MTDKFEFDPLSDINTARFKRGDVVFLKTESPAMTVWNVRPDDVVDVEWFSGSILRRDSFHADELLPARAPYRNFVDDRA